MNKCSKTNLKYFSFTRMLPKRQQFFPSLDSLVQVKISEPFGCVFGQGDLAVVEDYPATLLKDVTDVVTDHVRSSHVRNESHLWKNIKMSFTIDCCNYTLKSPRFWLPLIHSKPTGRPSVATMIFFQHLVAMKISQSTFSYENLCHLWENIKMSLTQPKYAEDLALSVYIRANKTLNGPYSIPGLPIPLKLTLNSTFAEVREKNFGFFYPNNYRTSSCTQHTIFSICFQFDLPITCSYFKKWSIYIPICTLSRPDVQVQVLRVQQQLGQMGLPDQNRPHPWCRG
jgi:hypothetical protein